jgi:hypothetical protein
MRLGWQACSLLKTIRPSFINLPHQAPVTKGAFYFFNHPQSAQNAIQYLASLTYQLSVEG